MSREPSPASPYLGDESADSPGAAALTTQNQSSTAAKFAAHQASTQQNEQVSPERASLPTNNNAQRTAAMEVTGGHVDAGITSSRDSAYVSVAAIKGHVPEANVEVLSGSFQAGAQTEFQVGLARVNMTSELVSWDVRTLEAEAHSGVHNPDGSTGINQGNSFAAIATELTVGNTSASLTVGAATGWGEESSLGKRDADNDGNAEYCFRRSFGNFVVGACVEPAAVSAGARQLYDTVATTFNRRAN